MRRTKGVEIDIALGRSLQRSIPTLTSVLMLVVPVRFAAGRNARRLDVESDNQAKAGDPQLPVPSADFNQRWAHGPAVVT